MGDGLRSFRRDLPSVPCSLPPSPESQSTGFDRDLSEWMDGGWFCLGTLCVEIFILTVMLPRNNLSWSFK